MQKGIPATIVEQHQAIALQRLAHDFRPPGVKFTPDRSERAPLDNIRGQTQGLPGEQTSV